jgi:alkyl hydroperoxide reductase subunit AhpC
MQELEWTRGEATVFLITLASLPIWSESFIFFEPRVFTPVCMDEIPSIAEAPSKNDRDLPVGGRTRG